MPDQKTLIQLDFSKQNNPEAYILRKTVLAHIKNLIYPLIEKLRLSVNESALPHLKILVQQLQQVVLSLGDMLDGSINGLTLKEIAICSLIKSKMSSKEIAEFLHISPLTVQTHRNRIRKKMNLLHSRASLQRILNQEIFEESKNKTRQARSKRGSR